MKKKKRVLSILLCTSLMFSISQMPIRVSAERIGIGDTYNFGAPSIPGSTIGSTVVDTRTDAQKTADSVNRSTLNAYSNLCETYIRENVKTTEQKRIQMPDRYVLVYEEDTPRDKLQQITEYKDGFDPNYGRDGYYKTKDGYSAQHQLGILAYDELKALADAVNRQFGRSFTPKEISEFAWYDPSDPDASKILTLINKLITDKGGKYVRKKIVGDLDLLDFDTFDQRLKALNTYLNTFSAEDTVKTEYIIEIKAESNVRNQLRSSKGLCWGNSGQTHYWQFSCLNPADGEYRTAAEAFGGPTFSQTFFYAGSYHVTASQILQQTYYDALTYSVNEYWVVADTGQIIYKNEIAGSTIKTGDTPMNEQNLRNAEYFKEISNGIYYVTMKTWDIEVIDNRPAGYLDNAGVWSYDFSTQRIR